MTRIFTFLFLLATATVSLAQDQCQAFGWATFDGQTKSSAPTGGGNATPVQVTTFAALKSAAESSDPKVIYVMNDVGAGYKGTSGDVLNVKSNKTIIGYKPNITVKCSWQISGVSNVIVRNLICRGPGNSNSEQNWDCVNIGGSKRVWFDHCTVMEGEDGNFDVVKGSDNVTVTWCKFTYVTGGSHNLSNLVGSSDNEPVSHGKLNITYAYCWWDNVNSRCPRTRYGKIHVLNCYYNNTGQGPHAGFMSNIRAEGCFFESNVSTPIGLTSPGGQSGCFAIDCNRGTTKTDGYSAAFTPPYEYKKYANSEVKAMVTDAGCGAGPTMDNPTTCCGSAVKDCNGVSNGTAYLDACNICVGGNTGKTACVKDCNGTNNGTATLDNCSRCIGGTTGKTACAASGEAETEACSYEGTIDNDNAGFKGTGFINVPNAIGSKITFGLNASTAGSKTLSFRYANGGTANRPGDVYVNGIKAGTVPFAPTGAFTTYGAVDIALTLSAGNNKVELVSTTADGLANVDQIGYVSTGINKGSCVITTLDSELETLNSIIYPNPSREGFRIQTSIATTVQLMDLEGKLIEEHHNVLDTEVGRNLPTGVYFVKLGNRVTKVIKQ